MKRFWKKMRRLDFIWSRRAVMTVNEERELDPDLAVELADKILRMPPIHDTCANCGNVGDFEERGTWAYEAYCFGLNPDGSPHYTGDADYHEDHPTNTVDGVFCRECGAELTLPSEDK